MRLPRVVLPGVPLHVTHRGNRGGPVFFDDSDRRVYLSILRDYADRFGLEVWAYCLMTNHVHLLVVPRTETAAALAIGVSHRIHSRRVNTRNGWLGHLWANRYFSTVLDEHHLWCAVRYIELNPLRGGLVARAEDYRWSSARAHVDGLADPLLSNPRPFPGTVRDWSSWLAEGTDPAAEALLRQTSRTGRPCGSASFVAGAELELGRILRALPTGRRKE